MTRSPDGRDAVKHLPPPEDGEPKRRSGAIALAITVASAMVVATCSARDRNVPPVTPAAMASAQDALAGATSSASATAESAAPPMPTEFVPAPVSTAAQEAAPAQEPEARGKGHELDRFYAALRALERKSRPAHVRIAWLGDSHGAADLWSGPLREALQARFGNGGPGFVHLGYKSYRHEGIKLEIRGKWATTPKNPATGVRAGDGIFGLGGVLLTGNAEGPRAAITVTDAALPPSLSWDLCYKLAARQDELQVSLTGQPDRTLRADVSTKLGALAHVTMTSTGASPTLRATPVGGQPKLCGAVAETDPKTQPGVVLDTLGINGARLTTPLAWDEASWVPELARRAPALVILEYGTNESGDHSINPARYVDNMQRVMARVRTASPSTDCLVLAPTDRADTLEKTPLVRDALREAAKVVGCGFWDTYTVMGGKASIVTWKTETPPRAGGDGVHLTARGYRFLGDRLAADVLSGYRP